MLRGAVAIAAEPSFDLQYQLLLVSYVTKPVVRIYVNVNLKVNNTARWG